MSTEAEAPVTYPYEPDYALPPGSMLEELLEERGISQVEGARRLGVSTKHLNQVINGSAPLSHDFALALERATGVPAEHWNAWEAHYREFHARKREAKRLQADLDWLDELPIDQMIGDGQISDLRDRPIEQLREVLRFFGVASRKAYRDLCAAKRLHGVELELADDLAIAIWLRVGELRVAQLRCEPFDRAAFLAALAEVRGFTAAEDLGAVWDRVVERCAAAGVGVALVPVVDGAEVDAAARWLTPSRALIQVSLRDPRAERFWSAFFHAAGHLLLHSKKCTFVDGPHTEHDDTEQEADRFARDLLIPRAKARALASLSAESEIRAFAESVGVGTAVVVGRLRADGLIVPDHFASNDLSPRYEFP